MINCSKFLRYVFGPKNSKRNLMLYTGVLRSSKKLQGIQIKIAIDRSLAGTPSVYQSKLHSMYGHMGVFNNHANKLRRVHRWSGTDEVGFYYCLEGQIDYIMVDCARRSEVTDAEASTVVNLGSDHEAVRMTRRIQRRTRRK